MKNRGIWEEALETLKKKILSAILSSAVFALIFSSLGGFSANAFFNFYYLNLMIAIGYGLIASIGSDWLSRKLSKRIFARELISFILHCFFGLSLQILGLVSAISFFIADRLLAKVKLEWKHVVIGGSVAVILFFILVNS